MKKLLTLIVICITSINAKISEDQAEWLRRSNTQKYAQFFENEEIEINLTDLSLLMLRINRDTCLKLAKLMPINYDDVSDVMTYENYIDFLPHYTEYRKYQKTWERRFNQFATAQALAITTGIVSYRHTFRPDESTTVKKVLTTCLYVGLMSLGLEIVESILLNVFKHKKHIKACTLKIKNMSLTEVAENKKIAQEASLPKNIRIQIDAIESDRESVMINVMSDVFHMSIEEARTLVEGPMPCIVAQDISVEAAQYVAMLLEMEGCQVSLIATMSHDQQIIMQQYLI